uniref:Cyclin-like domain-containing protein n=1 Tax=Kalanchoe fedtschenkoi TaxID=63787 RepID=A0A7N0SVG5_KALFE
MAGYVSVDSSTNHGHHEHIVQDRVSKDAPSDEVAGRWYMFRKEIEENSPSRQDGIDLRKETYLRKSYCAFLQDLGMRLKVPQVTIATAIIFCHRFFLRQSHAKNDRRAIATVCMFLAGKVEETPRPLKDVILVSYDIIHKKDPVAAQKIKQKEVYEQQKELILIGERVVLVTLAFDLNVHHPYKPLVEAIKKFKVAQNLLAQVAWNFVNDGLRTSLCLQFKPHHIAAGAIFLAAKFLKVKLPSDGEKVWWQEFDVTPRQLEEVSNQMLELYEQNKMPQGSEIEGSSDVAHKQRGQMKTLAVHDESVPSNGHAAAGAGSFSSFAKSGASKQTPLRSGGDHLEYHSAPSKNGPNPNNDNGSTEMGSVITEHKFYGETKDERHSELRHEDDAREASNMLKANADKAGDYEIANKGNINDTAEAGELKEPGDLPIPENCRSKELGEGSLSMSARDALSKLDTSKFKAVLEKNKKSRPDITRKMDVVDEDDLIERALEDGVESAIEDERIKRERRLSWSRNETHHHGNDHESRGISKGPSSRGTGSAEFVEEGEMLDDSSLAVNGRKRKGSPLDRGSNAKHCYEYGSGHHRSSYETHEDGHRSSRGGGYTEREHT